MPPAVTATAGDWKLIRLFHQGEDGAHAYRLYHLKDDIAEVRDLAAEQPDRVRHLDALITKFLADTDAVVPLPNPAYRPGAVEARKTVADPLKGWKARGCNAEVADGIVTITGTTATPFLGVSAAKLAGPATVRFRVRASSGGPGKVEWLATPAAAGKARSVEFQLQARDDWEEITVELPAEGPLGIARLYLPAQHAAVQLDWVEVKPSNGPARRWDF